jgi:hypothetical protein
VVVITSEMELLDAAVVITTSKLVDVVDVVVMADELCTDPGRAAHWEPGEYVKLTGGKEK